MAARHIIEKGHKKVLAIGAFGFFLKGAEETLNSHADVVFECCNILVGGHPEPNPQAIFDYMRQSALHPTAVIIDDALTAARLAKICMNQGLSLPADLSIIAYDYLPNIETYQVPLTLVEQPIGEIITATRELLTRRIQQPDSEYRQNRRSPQTF
jgi:DNA-binding LacI/PurR family transcriptional regulator